MSIEIVTFFLENIVLKLRSLSPLPKNRNIIHHACPCICMSMCLFMLRYFLFLLTVTPFNWSIWRKCEVENARTDWFHPCTISIKNYAIQHLFQETVYITLSAKQILKNAKVRLQRKLCEYMQCHVPCMWMS